MNIQQAVPLIKRGKTVQVDYFTSQIVTRLPQILQDSTQSIKMPKQKEILWNYLQNEEIHNQKYWQFKRLVNQKYFEKQLPKSYKQSIVSDTLKTANLTNSLTIRKINESVLESSQHLDQSVINFVSNYDLWKSGKLVKKPNSQKQKSVCSTKNSAETKFSKVSKSVSRYQPDTRFSVVLEEDQKHGLRNRRTIQTSIQKRNFGQGIKRPFQTMKARPMSQQMARGTEKIKNIIQNSINPQTNQKNIRHHLKTLTEQKTLNQKIVKTERKSILDTISKEKLIKFLQQSKSINPKRKGIHSLQDLTSFQKFNLTFSKYMKLKTMIKINSNAYQKYVKEKNGNLEKFQKFILQQFPIENESKRKLENIFEQIKWQFIRAERRKKVQKR